MDRLGSPAPMQLKKTQLLFLTAGLLCLLLPVQPSQKFSYSALIIFLGAMLYFKASWRRAAQLFWLSSLIFCSLHHRHAPKKYLEAHPRCRCQAKLLRIEAPPAEEQLQRECRSRLLFSINSIEGHSLKIGQFLEIDFFTDQIDLFQHQEQGTFDLVISYLPSGYFNEGRSWLRLHRQLMPRARVRLFKATYVHHSLGAQIKRAFDNALWGWFKAICETHPELSRLLALFFSVYKEALLFMAGQASGRGYGCGTRVILAWSHHRICWRFSRKPFKWRALVQVASAWGVLFFCQTSFLYGYTALRLLSLSFEKASGRRGWSSESSFLALSLLQPWQLVDASMLFFFLYQRLFARLFAQGPVQTGHTQGCGKNLNLAAALQRLKREGLRALCSALLSHLWGVLFDEPAPAIYLFHMQPLCNAFLNLTFPVLLLNGALHFLNLNSLPFGGLIWRMTLVWLSCASALFSGATALYSSLSSLSPPAFWGCALFILFYLAHAADARCIQEKGCSALHQTYLSALQLLRGAAFIQALFFRADDMFYVDMLDVGHGMALVIRKNRRALLIDAAARRGKHCVAQQTLIPYLQAKQQHVEGIFITHADNDHAGGLSELKRHFPCAPLFSSMSIPEECEPIQRLKAGDRLSWRGSKISVLWPRSLSEPLPAHRNAHSLSLLIQFKEFQFLVTGDIGAKVEKQLELPASLEDSPLVLQVAHHGSKSSSSWQFLKRWAPSIAINSSGGRSSSAQQEVQTRFLTCGIALYSTHRAGRIEVSRRFGKWRITTYRQAFFKYWWKK